MSKPLRLVIYDETALRDGFQPEENNDRLTMSWVIGAKLYKLTRATDIIVPVQSWHQLGSTANAFQLTKRQKISEIQFWGHGSPGSVYIGRDKLTIERLKKDGDLQSALFKLRACMTDDALIWFRCCSVFAGPKGHEFAKEFSEMMDCTVAAHTHIIHVWQAGLHTIRPGQEPTWPVTEGYHLDENGKEVMKWSIPFFSPNGIFCLRSTIPKGW